jgi:hypothetical protein
LQFQARARGCDEKVTHGDKCPSTARFLIGRAGKTGHFPSA